MASKNNITKWIIRGIGLVLIFLLILLLLGTWLINRAPFQNKLRSLLAEQTDNAVTFEHLRLSLLPRPRVTLDKAHITVPERMDVLVQSATVYPEILPLLRGKILLTKVRLDQPEIHLKFAEEPGAPPEDAKTVFDETRAELESAAKSVEAIAPDFFAEVIRGKLIVRNHNGIITTMDGINGSIALLPRGFNVRISGRDQYWGAIALNGSLYARRNSITVKNLSLAGGRSAISGLSARFRWKKRPYLEIRSGQAVILLEDIYERRALLGGLTNRLSNIKNMKGTIRLNELNFIGPLLHQDQWKMQASGSVEGITVQHAVFPLLQIETSEFNATTKTLLFKNMEASFMDSTFTSTVGLTGSFDRLRSIELSLRGRVGRKMIHWTAKQFSLPGEFILHGPLLLSKLRYTWQRGSAFTLAGSATIGNGPVLSFDLKRSPKELAINRLTIEDEENTASLSLKSTEKRLDLAFRGTLYEATLNKMFERISAHHGWLRGDLRANLLFDKPHNSSARGALAAGDLFFRRQGVPVTIREFDLRADDKIVTLNTGSFVWGHIPVGVKGRVRASEDGFRVNMDLETTSLNVAVIQQFLGIKEKEKEEKKDNTVTKASPRRLPIVGTIRVQARDFTLGKYRFSPVVADVFLDRNSVRIEFIDAKLCDISVPGHLQPIAGEWLLHLAPAASGQPIEAVLKCLENKTRITGNFNLNAKLHAKGKSQDLVRALQGRVEFTAKNGKIYTYPLLARIFAFLNVTELLRGKVPDMGRDGFAYKSIKIRGDIRDGRLVLREAALEGATLNLAADGVIDLASNTLDVTVLVAPFKTIEYLLSKIPLVRNLLANKLVTVPIRLTGDLHKPDVTPLDPKATGQHVLDIMKGILELPFQVLDPLLGRDRKS